MAWQCTWHDKQLNCVFWFQNPLKDLVRPLYNYSRTDPVRCPDSPSIYMSCVLCLSLSLSTRSLLFQTSLFANIVANFIVGNCIFPFYFCLNYLGRIVLYLCRTVIVCLFNSCLNFFGENVGVFIFQNCLFCWLTMVKLAFSLINKFYYVLSHNLT